MMLRAVLPLLPLVALAGCSGSPPVDRELVCSVAASPAYSPLPDGGAAWEWPETARAEIERTDWTEAEQKLVRSCGSGTRPAVVRLAFSADRRLALITRSSFERGGAAGTDPLIEQGSELSGSIESCLLRLEKILSSEIWQPVACRLDAVS